MIQNSTKGYRTLEDIGADRDLAEFSNLLWWNFPWRTKGMKNMPWWYYQARNHRQGKQRKERLKEGL